MDDRQQTLRVSVDDLDHATSLPRRTLRPRTANYGNVAQAPASPPSLERGSLYLRAWFYLGGAGLVGALLAWALVEPGYVDGATQGWGDIWLMPMVVSLMCVGLAVIESLVERSPHKAWRRAGWSFALGLIFGFVLDRVGEVIYNFGLGFCSPESIKAVAPGVWIARGMGWAVIGIAGGIVYGIVGRSWRKAAYGALGGALGATAGGVLFDPISFLAHGGALSRAVGLGLLGFSTGTAMGLVESALKTRWLYVTAGPLAGKQFILYKPETRIGSRQGCDIYLFKDSEIQAEHAVLQLKGNRLCLKANGPVIVAGETVLGEQILENGWEIEIGRYGFRYQEKEQ